MQNNFSWDLDYPYIAHYGVPHGQGPNGGSGRYPWGSGEKWRKIRAGVKNAGDKIKKFFGGKDGVDTSAVPKNWDQMTPAERAEWSNKHLDALLKGESSTQKLTSSDSDGNKTPITTTPKTETPIEPAKPNKKTALESGSREEILKVFQESSNEEIQRAINKAQLMDSLNKSIADAKPKQPETKSPEQMAKEERADYIKEALGSGDYNRIMEVATDKSVSNQDLQNALNKMNTIQSAQEKNSASAKFFENADRFKNAIDKTLGYYDTAANVWNTIAVNYNNTADVKAGKSQPLGLLLTVPKNNNNQKNQNNQNNQQQNQQQGPPKPQQNQNQQNNQQQVQQKQNNQNNQNNQQQNPQKPQQNQNNQQQNNQNQNQKQQNNQKQQSQQSVQTQQKQQTQAAPKQVSQETIQKIQQAVQKVSNKSLEDAYFPDDDNYTPKSTSSNSSNKSNDLSTYYKSLSKQDIPSWMYKQSLSDYGNYSTDYDYLDHSSLGDEVFEFVAHYGVPHGQGPNGGSGRYPWGSGLNPKNKQKSFFQREKKKTELSKWNPWNNREQMQDYVNKNKKAYFFYQSQLDSDDAYKREYAHQILSKPINTWNYYVDKSKAKNPVDWFLNKDDRKYANAWLDKHEEYSDRIANMRLSDAPDENIINFMLYYGMDQKHSQTNFMTKGNLIYQ